VASRQSNGKVAERPQAVACKATHAGSTPALASHVVVVQRLGRDVANVSTAVRFRPTTPAGPLRRAAGHPKPHTGGMRLDVAAAARADPDDAGELPLFRGRRRATGG
jgi:hypothetical protein